MLVGWAADQYNARARGLTRGDKRQARADQGGKAGKSGFLGSTGNGRLANQAAGCALSEPTLPPPETYPLIPVSLLYRSGP